MSTKHKVHNPIILDEGGSMESIKEATVQGFNEIVQTIKGVEKQFPEHQHFISLVSFDGLGRKTRLWQQPVKDLQQLNATTYSPNASTPLFDAMGISISKPSAHLTGPEGYNVLVTIFTDREENCSVEYSGQSIKKLVGDLKGKRWTFTYIGTDHYVDKIALSISITNVMKFEKNEASMQQTFAKERAARSTYSQKIQLKEDTKDNFYEDNK